MLCLVRLFLLGPGLIIHSAFIGRLLCPGWALAGYGQGIFAHPSGGLLAPAGGCWWVGRWLLHRCCLCAFALLCRSGGSLRWLVSLRCNSLRCGLLCNKKKVCLSVCLSVCPVCHHDIIIIIITIIIYSVVYAIYIYWFGRGGLEQF
jgi:hypothetical protein